MSWNRSPVNSCVTNLNAAYDALTPQGTKKSKLSHRSIKMEGLGDAGSRPHSAPGSPLTLTASQNLLRIGLREVRRRSGIHDGLNVAVACRPEGQASATTNTVASKDSFSSTGIAEKFETFSPERSSASFFRITESSSSVFDVDEASDSDFYAEEEDQRCADAGKSASGESMHSIVSYYANPNFGRGQRENLKNPAKASQSQEDVASCCDSTQVILSPLVSEPTLFLDDDDQSQTFLEEDDDADADEFKDCNPSPIFVAREYTRQLSPNDSYLATFSGRNSDIRENMTVTDIPCDSWIALPFRMLPGTLVPDGIVLLIPLILIFLTISLLVQLFL